ncbi:MAG: recombinase family protein [Rhodobacteraceae bacterium]|nr:recombinase family protein [Paracoccaceae bacterium]
MTRSPASRKQVRCAIYTRKSTEEGLEQAFNSLDAQRESCAAYVASQKHEGWTALADRYDDGGFSGGSIERPALQALLSDVQAGKIDVVVVYKVDRLTRALADFARIVAIFDAAGVSFVSVTQAFNTTTSMGRLTLNVLLSFAQFEREVTAERIRDKIAASKAKGMWMGGTVPIGYRVEHRKLVPVPEEAALVQRIVERYLALGSVSKLKTELDQAAIRTPLRHHGDGGQSGGAAFSRGKLYLLLANPVFIGRIRHKDAVHPGQHAAILDESLWRAVQEKLADNRRRRTLQIAAQSPSALAGKLFDPDGEKMRPSHARKNGRRYRYYVSRDLVERSVDDGAHGWRIPAGEIESAVSHALAARLGVPDFRSEILHDHQGGAEASNMIIGRITEVAEQLNQPGSACWQDLLRSMIIRVDLTGTELRLEASFASPTNSTDADPCDLTLAHLPPFTLTAPIELQRRGPELRLVLQGAAAREPRPDALLLRTLIEGRARAADYLHPEQRLTVSDVARRHGADVGDVSRSLQLVFLAPDLVACILDGTQPLSLTAERLKRVGELPLLWDEQRALLA